MAFESHHICCRRSWFSLTILLLLIAGTTSSSLEDDVGVEAAAAPAVAFPIHQVREVFSNATVEQLAEFPPDVLDMIFNHEPPNIGRFFTMEESIVDKQDHDLDHMPDRSLLFGRDNHNKDDHHNNMQEVEEGPQLLSPSFFRCFGRELRAMQNQFDQNEYKKMVLSEAGIEDEKEIRTVLKEQAKNDGKRFRRTPMAQSIFSAIHQHYDEFYEVYNMYNACQREVDEAASATAAASLSGEENFDEPSYYSAEGSGIRAGQAFLQAMNRNPKVRRRLQTSAPSASPSASPSLAPSASPSASPSSNGFINLGFHVEVGIIGDYSFSSFNGDTSTANPGCFGRRDFNRNCVGVEAGAGFEFSFMMLFDSQLVAPQGQSCWFDFDIGVGTAAGFGVGNYLDGTGQQFDVSIGSGFGIGMGGAWCWDFNA